MRLSEPIEKPGFFWLPEVPENHLLGVLRISESVEVTLEVSYFGNQSDIWAKQNLNRIIGIIDNDLIALDKCFYRKRPLLQTGVSTAIIHAHSAFIGAKYDEKEEIAFSRVTFSIEGLNEWLSISGFDVKRNWEDRSISIYFKLPQEILLNLPEGIKLKFGFNANMPSESSITKATIAQKSYISLISENLRPLDDFLSLISKLHNFLCFVIDKTVSLETVTGYSNEITREIEVGKEYEIPIKIYYQSPTYSETTPKIHCDEMLFRYRDIAEQLEGILTKWIENYEIAEPAFNLYFAYKSGANKYLDSKFLSLAQGIETLHRRNSKETMMPDEEFRSLIDKILQAVPDSRDFINKRLKNANELPLRQRIKKMIEPFKNFFKSERKCDSFINKVVDTRNYLTHHNSDWAYRPDLLKLHLKLEAFFQLLLLRLVGFNAESINSIVQRSHSLCYKLEIEHETFSEKPM